MIRAIRKDDFTPDGENINLRVEDALLIVVDKESEEIICAVIGDDADVLRVKAKYDANPNRYDIEYTPPSNETPLADYDGPVYSPYNKSAWEEQTKPLVKSFLADSEDIFPYVFDPTRGQQLSPQETTKLVYSLLFCDEFVSPELSVSNRNPQMYDPAYISPADAYSLTLGNTSPIVPLKTVWKELKRQKSILATIADYKREDGTLVRFQIQYLYFLEDLPQKAKSRTQSAKFKNQDLESSEPPLNIILVIHHRNPRVNTPSIGAATDPQEAKKIAEKVIDAIWREFEKR